MKGKKLKVFEMSNTRVDIYLLVFESQRFQTTVNKQMQTITAKSELY